MMFASPFTDQLFQLMIGWQLPSLIMVVVFCMSVTSMYNARQERLRRVREVEEQRKKKEVELSHERQMVELGHLPPVPEAK
jgi:hypothetical protein